MLAASDRLSGVLGLGGRAAHACEPGYETAVAAALGSAADAVAVVDVGSAEAAIRLLKDDDAGRVGLLVGAPVRRRRADAAARAARRAPARALDLVTAPDALRPP